MHPLLIPYSFMALMLLMSASGRTVTDRTFTWFFSWAALLLVLVAVLGRPLRGDLRRYDANFQSIRDSSLKEIVSLSDPNSAYLSLTWTLGRFTTDFRLVLIAIGLFTVFFMIAASKKLLSRHHIAIMLFVYSMYPFFIFYISSALKTALSLSIMLLGLVWIYRRRKRGWAWLGLSILFHKGTLLILPFLLLHLGLYRIFGERRALMILLGFLSMTIVLSITNYNSVILGAYRDSFASDSRYDIYFMDPEIFNYSAGFRIDFTLFSLIPIASYFYLVKMRGLTNVERSGWWLCLYTSFALIYQLFSFAPFADRFAAFSWFLLPLILMLQVVDSQSRIIMVQVVGAFVVVNILALQFYTGRVLLW
jgi:hypothetical protein